MIHGHVTPKVPCKAAWRRHSGVGASLNFSLSHPPEYTIFAASLLTPTPSRAVLLAGECLRDDVAGIPFAGVSPQKRRAMAPGAEGNVLQGHYTVRGSQHDTTSAGAGL